MTQPPRQPGPFGQNPHGQSGWQGQPQPGHYGQNPSGQHPSGQSQPDQHQPGQQGGAYPQTGPGPAWGTPAQGFSPPSYGQQPSGQSQPGQYGQPGYGQFGQQPYGQFDGNQGDYPGGQRPKKTGLIVGLVILGLLVVGGIVTLILVLTSSDDNNTASGNPLAGGQPPASGPPSATLPTSSAPSATTTTTASNPPQGTGGTGGTGDPNANKQLTPEVLNNYLAQAYTDNNPAAVTAAFCSPEDGANADGLPLPNTQAQIDVPSHIQGSSGQIGLRLTHPGSNGTMIFNVQQSNGGWCVSKIASFQPSS